MAKEKRGTRGTPPAQPSTRNQRLSLYPLSLEEALRGAAATGGPPDMPKRERRKRQPDEPTAPDPETLADSGERPKDATRKADERARRMKRPGATGIRGGTSKD